jgi:hypothetical protein
MGVDRIDAARRKVDMNNSHNEFAQNPKPQSDFWMPYGGWVIAVLIIVCSLTTIAFLTDHCWGWVVGLLPAALVAQHAAYLINVKREAVSSELAGEPDPDRSGTETAPISANRPAISVAPQQPGRGQQIRLNLMPARRKVRSQTEFYFDRRQITIQYSTLTILLAVVGVLLIFICCDPPACLVGTITGTGDQAAGLGSTLMKSEAKATDNPGPAGAATDVKGSKTNAPPGKADLQDKSSGAAPSHAITDAQHVTYLTALRLGAAGAFIYVLIYLGRRNFQRDITGGAALWSAVQLVLGPTLAFTIAYFLTPSGNSASGAVGFGALYFLAGLSPRLIADWISETVQRAWISPRAMLAASRLIPLAQIRGITPLIESRLNEEGIEDAADLAMANPVKLLRTTPFDPRQILSWIDEAMLITTLPLHWDALEKEGVTGAMDLAWYVQAGDEETPVEPGVESQSPPIEGYVPGGIVDLARLADRIKIDREALYDVALRLLGDNQLQMVMAMYQSNGDDQSANGGS